MSSNFENVWMWTKRRELPCSVHLHGHGWGQHNGVPILLLHLFQQSYCGFQPRSLCVRLDAYSKLAYRFLLGPARVEQKYKQLAIAIVKEGSDDG